MSNFLNKNTNESINPHNVAYNGIHLAFCLIFAWMHRFFAWLQRGFSIIVLGKLWCVVEDSLKISRIAFKVPLKIQWLLGSQCHFRDSEVSSKFRHQCQFGWGSLSLKLLLLLRIFLSLSSLATVTSFITIARVCNFTMLYTPKEDEVVSYYLCSVSEWICALSFFAFVASFSCEFSHLNMALLVTRNLNHDSFRDGECVSPKQFGASPSPIA